MVSLCQVDADPDDLAQLGLALDTLGDRGQAQRVRQLGDRLHHRCPLVHEHLLHETAVDLQEGDRKLLQVRQRRVPGAEIVHRKAHTERADPLQDPTRLLGVAHDGALGDLQHQLRCRQVEFGQHREDTFRQPGVVQLSRRQVHVHGRHRVEAKVATPLANPSKRFPQDELADFLDDPRRLGLGDECPGAEQTSFGMVPSNEGLGFDHLPAAGVVNGLKLHEQLTAGGGPAKGGLHLETLECRRVHLRFVDPIAGLALFLGGVHGEVGVSQQVRDAHRAVPVGDPDRRAGAHPTPSDQHRLVEHRNDPFGHDRRLTELVKVFDEYGELVAAEAGRGVGAAKTRVQPVADRDQHLVADKVPEAVVDGLEVVEVDEQHRDGRVRGPESTDRQLDSLAKQRAVGETRQRVVKGLAGELFVELATLGDVPVTPDATDDLAVDPLRHRDTFDAPPIGEVQLVAEFRVGSLGQVVERGQELVGVCELGGEQFEEFLARRGVEHLAVEPPHLEKAPVPHGDLAGGAGDADSVRRGFEGGGEHRVGAAKRTLDRDAIGDVVAAQHQRCDRLVIEQILHGDEEGHVTAVRGEEFEIEALRLGRVAVSRHEEVQELPPRRTILLAHDLLEGHAFDRFLVVAQQSGDHDRTLLDQTVGSHEQGQHIGIGDERTKSRLLVMGDLPPTSIGDVADHQHDSVVLGRSDHFAQTPTVRGLDPHFDRGADLFVLHRGHRGVSQCQVVGVQQVQTGDAAFDGFAEGHLKDLFGRMVGPEDLTDRAHQQHAVGQVRHEATELRHAWCCIEHARLKDRHINLSVVQGPT